MQELEDLIVEDFKVRMTEPGFRITKNKIILYTKYDGKYVEETDIFSGEWDCSEEDVIILLIKNGFKELKII